MKSDVNPLGPLPVKPFDMVAGVSDILLQIEGDRISNRPTQPERNIFSKLLKSNATNH